MPITTTQPINQNGHTYPYLSVNLAVSPLVEDYIGGSIAMKLTPYREIDPADGGGFEFLDDQAKNVVYLDVFREIDEIMDSSIVHWPSTSVIIKRFTSPPLSGLGLWRFPQVHACLDILKTLNQI